LQQTPDQQTNSSSFGEVFVTKPVTVHRLNLKRDVLEVFTNEKILDYEIKFTVLDHRGEREIDIGSGVARDIISAYFEEFSLSDMTGFSERVPVIRHDMLNEKWKAVARLLLYSYRVDCFPTVFARAFIASTIVDETLLTKEMIISSFLLFLPPADNDIVKEMLYEFDESKLDALMDVLSGYNCFRPPKEDNLKTILYELGHHELVQKPRYSMELRPNTDNLITLLVNDLHKKFNENFIVQDNFCYV